MLPSNSNAVGVRIKSPVARHPDLMLACDRQLSVRGLKGLIETRYPARPPPADQKLVYAGKLLSDDLLLEQFLRFEDDCSLFTIHLVCKIPEQPMREAIAPVPAANSAADGLRYRGADGVNMSATAVAASEHGDHNS